MKLTEKIEKLTKELQLSLKLLDKFPDLEIKKDRWNKEFYVSKLINEQTTNVDFIHSCGCCSDATTLAMPYLIYEEQNIYSDPFQIAIGQSYSGGEFPHDYRAKLKEHNIPEIIIKQVEQFFEENKVEDCESELE